MSKRFQLSSKWMFGAAIVASLGACGGVEPDVETTSDEIIGGFPARSARFNAVGALGFANGGPVPQPFCTGTLITPTVVLTAEHCVDFITDPSQVFFLIGYDAAAPTQIVPVRGVAWEQSVEGGLIGLGSDVAVMHLAAPVVGVQPMAYGAIDASQVGRKFAGIGYGVQDALGTFGTRRTGSETFQQVGGPLFGAIYGSFEQFVEDGAGLFFPGIDPNDPAGLAELQAAYDATTLLDVEAWFGNGPNDAQACFGDSGGPIVAQLAGKTTVFGVASWVAFADELCQLGAAYATLNPITLDFIDYELNCPMIPREGTCEDITTAVRCATALEGGYRELRTDCSELGLVCGLDEAGEIGCVEDPCEGLPAEGTCEGSVAIRCSLPEEGPRRVLETDCAELGLACGFDEAGEIACIDDGVANCDHDTCTEGTRLDAECSECTAAICAVDPYCCETAWDSICVSETETVCGGTCPGATGVDPADVAARNQ